MKSTSYGIPIEARILEALGEPFAAGLYEDRNASTIRRFGWAMRRYARSVRALPPAAGPLYPDGPVPLWNMHDAAVSANYSFSLVCDGNALRRKIERQLEDPREKDVALTVVHDLENMGGNPLATRFHVGGAGYTHSILNYERLVTDGLPAWDARIARGLQSAPDADTRDFYEAARDALDAVRILLQAAVAACQDGVARATLQAVAERPPATFHEALALIHFMFYVDGCDSIGALDRYLAPFYQRDLAAGTLTRDRAAELLGVFYANVDAVSGWHMILGGADVPGEMTELCLHALRTRRPNTGLKVHAATSDAVWETALDCLRRGTGNPSFYNDRVYRASAVRLAGVAEDDLARIAYGGCTEFMVEGRANVGSIDAGLNLLRILEGTLQRELERTVGFDELLAAFKEDIRRQVAILTAELDLNQRTKAVKRPQLVRTLFIDDCLDRALEYNRGGARYNGGVINVAGIANAANSLYAVRAVLDGSLAIDRNRLLAALAADFEGHEDLRQRLLGLSKFGNNVAELDALAREITAFTFGEITGRRCWRSDGFLIPSTIMFTTYVREGLDIDATPDGRHAGGAIADSCGPMQGTDSEGPTSMLASTALLPQNLGLGTMILNLRINAAILKDPVQRRKLKSLLLAYFELGGMQVQVSALDADTLKDALRCPEAYENLVVRIGGFTEYFNRLGDDLKREVLKRTEQM